MNLERMQLHEALPLKTPFSLQVFPSYWCNFKCSYCVQSLSEAQLKQIDFKKAFLKPELFFKAVDEIAQFPDKLKAMLFAGLGEPLCHPQIAAMIAYAKKKNVAQRTEIVTNASLLTNELSDRLIDAGLDRLRISIQGVNAERYRELSGIQLDFEKFVDQIRYFYKKKTTTEVHIKIIDVALHSEDERKRFEEIFSPIADSIAIEHVVPFFEGVDYEKFNLQFNHNQHGEKHPSKICSMPFYMLVLKPNGDVVSCCNEESPIVYGNLENTTLGEIWNGAKLRNFLKMQLTDLTQNPICKGCTVPSFQLQPGDYLDDYKEQLLKLYKGV